MQRRSNVFDVGQTLDKCYTNVLRLLGCIWSHYCLFYNQSIFFVPLKLAIAKAMMPTSPFQCGDRLYTSESDVCRRQIMTCKDGPCTEWIKTFHKPYIYNTGIQMKRKELTIYISHLWSIQIDKNFDLHGLYQNNSALWGLKRTSTQDAQVNNLHYMDNRKAVCSPPE